jgi:hypothetical protein
MIYNYLGSCLGVETTTDSFFHLNLTYSERPCTMERIFVYLKSDLHIVSQGIQIYLYVGSYMPTWLKQA